ncbi:hypothetical protein Trco_004541 [Trichoderma cornu-damae]|uniref:Uncharacterized protein n=1 Tax=Trichoderma cornu-damae TaxID=654480 RepID=A0A9P8TX73_9HYPO|nr:hypothetical protein Trco_004541 [Trichoderma cornu-damae]
MDTGENALNKFSRENGDDTSEDEFSLSYNALLGRWASTGSFVAVGVIRTLVFAGQVLQSSSW